MPLHLLGKKSWNVYNSDNIARVRRDEAEAKAREEEEDRRTQEIDTERRIKILRGERPSTPPRPTSQIDKTPPGHSSNNSKSLNDLTYHRKRRRLAGEDDTDRDIRLAKEDAARLESIQRPTPGLAKRPVADDLPIIDSKGHTNLFTADMTRNNRGEKNPEAEADRIKKTREYEDQYTMRFSNAAGFKESVGKHPWYSSPAVNVSAPDGMPVKDVWGNEDLRRAEREKARIDANDPLISMKAGIRGLKKVERERKIWKDEQSKQLDKLRQQQKDGARHKHYRRSPVQDGLEGFQLDSPFVEVSKQHDKPNRHRRREHHSHHRRHEAHEHHRLSHNEKRSHDRI